MKKIFISQPMRDKTDEEILIERQKIIETIKNDFREETIILDSFFNFESFPDEPERCNHALFYLGKALEILCQADVAYFAYGWEDARGCQIENECAKAYGIDCIIMEGEM